MNNYTLDGADKIRSRRTFRSEHAQVVQPPVDALCRNSRSDAHLFFGVRQCGGAVINASVKHGTTSSAARCLLHARRALNANTWDNNRAGRPKGPVNQLIAGGTRRSDHQRQDFFFGTYQSRGPERALSQTATVRRRGCARAI